MAFLAGITLPSGTGRRGRQSTACGTTATARLLPNGPHGPGGWGLYVDTLPKALARAGVCLIVFLLFNYVLVSTARAHAAVARGLLGAAEDPLRQAKEVAPARPGPLVLEPCRA